MPKYYLFLWSALIFIICLGLMFLAVSREAALIESSQISVPSFSGGSGVPGSEGLGNISDAITIKSTGVPVLYFFLVAALLGIVLFFIPIDKLRLAMRLLFGFAFSWGTFIFFALFMPLIVAGLLAIGIGMAWLITPKIWLHNGLLILMLVSLGTVFGAMFSPWTVILIMLVISIYDFFAVKLGYMQWMARKLSETEVLPAFFIPWKITDWKTNLKGLAVEKIFENKGDKSFSLLGGGDIFFPLLLAASVWFASDIVMATVVALFSLLGIGSAYIIHLIFLKGRATPALPPIFVASLCGLLLVRFVLSA